MEKKEILEKENNNNMWHGFVHAWDGFIEVRKITQFINCKSGCVETYIEPFFVTSNTKTEALTIAKRILGY